MVSKSKQHDCNVVDLGRLGHPRFFFSSWVSTNTQVLMGSLMSCPCDLHVPKFSSPRKIVVDSASKASVKVGSHSCKEFSTQFLKLMAVSTWQTLAVAK